MYILTSPIPLKSKVDKVPKFVKLKHKQNSF